MPTIGYNTQTNAIVTRGVPPMINNRRASTATILPGMVAIAGATDYDCAVSDGINAPIGFVGFEQANLSDRPANLTTAYAQYTQVPIIKGGGFGVQANLLPYTKCNQGDLLASFTGGYVVPGAYFEGIFGIKIPFSKYTSDQSTSIALPGGIRVIDCIVNVVANVGSSTISVGFASGEGGSDTQLLAAESCANLGLVAHVVSNTTLGNITVGTSLVSASPKSADGTAIYAVIWTPYITTGTIKTIVYKTSNHSISGYFYVLVDSPGIQVIGKAGQSADATGGSSVPVFLEDVI